MRCKSIRLIKKFAKCGDESVFEPIHNVLLSFIIKGASKAYNSIKDLKNLSTDDLKNIKIPR